MAQQNQPAEGSAHVTSLDITQYAIYVQDDGALIGRRFALADSSARTAIISQHGNAYEEGFALNAAR